ncbi:MAG: ANTAR domain-containing protein, partial [Pseudomonadota bacterium]
PTAGAKFAHLVRNRSSKMADNSKMADKPKLQPLVLAFDESIDRLKLLGDALVDAGFERVHLLSDTSDILNRVIELRPDVILMEVESPSRDTLEQLMLVRDQQPTAVALITQDEEAQSIKSALDSGVCAYTAEGIMAPKVRPIIEIAMATFAKFKRLRRELANAREELGNHRRIERAKSLLMRVQGLSEDEAHKALRKLSMDRKRKLADVAEDLLAMSKLFTEPGA